MGQKYRKSSHGLYDLKAHLIWVTKYRYPVLQKDIALKLRALIRRIWARGFFSVSTGNVTAEMIENYIKNHKDEDEEFTISRA